MKTFVDKLITEGWTLVDSHGVSDEPESGQVYHLSRQTKVGSPPDKSTGAKPYVFIALFPEHASILVEAHNGDSWTKSALEDIPTALFQRHWKTYEKRVVFAWRELTD